MCKYSLKLQVDICGLFNILGCTLGMRMAFCCLLSVGTTLEEDIQTQNPMRMVVCYGTWSSLVTHSLPLMKLLLQNLQGPDIWRFKKVPNFSGELLNKECLLVWKFYVSKALPKISDFFALFVTGKLLMITIESNCQS